MNRHPYKNNLSGIEALKLLWQGHMVRRACWVKDFFIRICNEEGFDKDGNAIPQEDTAIYTIATSGYFMHIGTSSQPFKDQHNPRDGEGIQLFFENDWEDHGFISREDFQALTDELENVVRQRSKKVTRSFD